MDQEFEKVEETEETQAPEPETMEQFFWRILESHDRALGGLSLTMFEVLERLRLLEEVKDGKPQS